MVDMSSRGMENSGGALHVAMVKETVKMIAERFATMNRFMVQFEPWERVQMTWHMDRYEKTYLPRIDFRPDIILQHTPPEKREANSKGIQASFNYHDEKVWETIEDSTHVVFEVETKPSAIFRNKLKLAYYAKMKDNRDRGGARLKYAFILVVPEGSTLPEDTEPFDEVWAVKP